MPRALPPSGRVVWARFWTFLEPVTIQTAGLIQMYGMSAANRAAIDLYASARAAGSAVVRPLIRAASTCGSLLRAKFSACLPLGSAVELLHQTKLASGSGVLNWRQPCAW